MASTQDGKRRGASGVRSGRHDGARVSSDSAWGAGMLAKAYGNPYWTGRGVDMGKLGILTRKGFGALGLDCSQTDDTGTCLDSPSDVGTGPLVDCPGGPGCPGGITPTGSPASSSPFPWFRLANTFATDFSTIFKAVQPVPAGCTQVAGPYGTSVSCASPGQPAAGLNLPSSGIGSFMPMLLLAGAGLVAVKVFSK
jgi:hypothetical protein